jgi:uncharacterized protein YjbJ (UPF0337 family)
MKFANLDLDHLRGISEKALGLGKEFLGTAIKNEHLVDEGEAQQARGTDKLRALRKEAEAKAKQAEAQAEEAKAKVAEQKQRAAQHAKERRSA